MAYWGNLPTVSTVRRNSNDDRDNTEQLQYSQQRNSRSTSHRISVQSEAPTVSTQDSFASYTTSSFKEDGLAPRPPSLPYGAVGGYNRDFLGEKRRQRASREAHEYYKDNENTVPPPAAPDAPSFPPPVSYNQPYSNTGPPASYQPPLRSGSTRRSDRPVDVNHTGSASSYRDGRADVKASRSGVERGELNINTDYRREKRGRNSIGGDADKPRDYPDRVEIRKGTAETRNESPEYHDRAPTSRSRQTSLAETEAQRRREWAPERSPLQRLELTLDSITKEEKRARIKEAEIIAKEAEAGRGGDRLNHNTVRFKDRPAATTEGPAQPESQNLAEADPVSSLSKEKDELQQSGTVRRKKPVTIDSAPVKQLGKGFEYEPQQELTANTVEPEKPSGLQRGPSFRERATAPAAGAVMGAMLSRNTSKKLKKDPPGDPWFSRRQEAEKAYPEVTPRQQSNATVGAPSQSITVATASRKVQVNANGDNAKGPTRPDPIEKIDLGLDEGPPQPAPVGRNPKKIELTGHKFDNGVSKAIAPQQLPEDRMDLSEEYAPESSQRRRTSQEGSEVKNINENRYTGASKPAAGNYGQERTARRSNDHHHFNITHRRLSQYQPGDGLYVPPQPLKEWRNGAVGALTGTLLDLNMKQTAAEKDKAWWETDHSGKRAITSKKPKIETYDGEHEYNNGNSKAESRRRNKFWLVEKKQRRPKRKQGIMTRLLRVSATAPTQFNPPLYLKCGPLLRYCGLRQDRTPTQQGPDNTAAHETWRGSVLIVTTDSESSYKIAPTLRLFSQPMNLLPPPPDQVVGETGELAPEYVDPIAGLPKIGRDGRTLYVRPVEDLEEGKDLSTIETHDGLFESQRSMDIIQGSGHNGNTDQKTSISGRNQKPILDGEKLGKYVEVKGFRLHAQPGTTFWRFNIEVELRDRQQRIAYRINGGPATGFWVPARGQSMSIMFHSCNGFSLSVNPDQFSGPDPMWRDVLNTHQTKPFHVMIGGGDQIYNDGVMKNAKLFSHWLSIKNPIEKHNAPFTTQMQEELESFYLERYSMWFSQGLFGLANSQIPMVNIFDDHDIIDGFGSYPRSFMDAPVFAGLGAIAFKYYMLFQHQSVIDEGEETEPSWILGARPGPYIKELSRSIFLSLGSRIAFLGLDCRTERMQETVMTDATYIKIFDRMRKQIIKGETKHLIVSLGIPIAYPRLAWLENILTSRLMDPIKAVGKSPVFGNLIGAVGGGVEILDDINDHWTAKIHREERKELILDLQDLAAVKSIRVTILSGDVHLAAIGQFFSKPKLAIPKHEDFRYMPNVISSAIVNTPPPSALANMLNRRDKVHHMDEETDENMIPIFTKDVNGTNRSNKRLMPRRNWCSIREYNPDLTPPPTPSDEHSPSPPPRGNLFRRLSSSRGPSYRPDAGPPPSRGLMRNFSLRGRSSEDSERPPGTRQRTMSLTRKEFIPKNLFRRGSKRKPDDGGINGYGASSDEEELPDQQFPSPKLRGGAGDESYFPQKGTAPFSRTRVGRDSIARDNANGYILRDESPEHNRDPSHQPSLAQEPQQKPFHRTPTGISEKQRRKLGEAHDVNLEGGLDICLNVEVSQRDPAGITSPYRLLVPALWYEDVEEPQDNEKKDHLTKGGGLMGLVSFGRSKAEKPTWKGKEREENVDDE